MSHEFESGFSVRQPAWHGLALTLDHYPGREEAIRLSGQNWQVIERQLIMAETTNFESEPIDDWKGLIRSDNGTFLGAVKQTYEVVQNSTLWDLAEVLLDSKDLLYETAGVLREGRVVWVLVKLAEPIQIPGDNTTIRAFLRLSTTHDGSGALKAISTAVRTICWNTFSAGDREAKQSGLEFSFRHTRSIKDKIEIAKRTLGLAKNELAAFQQLANELAALPVSDKAVKTFVETFIPMPLEEGAVTDRIRDNIETARARVYNLINVSKTIPEEHRRTAYGLFNAGIEYLDHIRAFRSPETYFERTFTNNGALKSKLVTLAKEVAAS
jgi:phage/plasmid-like protein (TIGR03299 family)